MKRSVTCLLATVLLVAGVVPVGDAGAANRSNTAAAASATLQSQKNKATVKKPLHHQISFNDYQVVGLNENGWNWVRNNEFILPANTPLDIDMLQYTHSPNGKNAVNRKKVILDGTELVEFRGEVTSPEQVLPWKVPRFTIPASMLTAGEHLLTFIAEDGNGQSGMVSVKFMVEEPVSNLNIYQGTDATGPMIPSGSTQTIYANNGSMKFYTDEQGTWKIYTKGSPTELKVAYGLRFNTGTLEAGSYEIVYKPLKEETKEWRITLEIGLPPVYQIVNGEKQKIAPGQKITVPNVPGIIQLSADSPGGWYVNGTNQAAYSAQDFEVMIPETLRGMTVTVYYQPADSDGSSPSQIQIDVPVGEKPAANACDPSQALATMDIMTKGNADSDLELEKINLKSSAAAITIYQEPLHEIWLTTSADHMEHGSKADEEEGPGIWAVNNVVVDATRLNWDHTGLNIASFGVGTHNIRYISKGNTQTQWCGSIRVYEDEPPVLASLSCEADESGPSPKLMPIRLETDQGEELPENGSVEINSLSELSKYDALTMKANHVANYGTKRIKKGTKSNRSYLTIPDVRWEYDVNYFGEKQNFGGNIFSENKVDILYEDKVIETIRPKSERDKGDKSGTKILNLESIIKENKAKPGKYTIRITHELANNECKINRRYDVDDKDIDRVEQKQVFTTSIVLK